MGVPNTFAAVTTATGQQLDDNFTACYQPGGALGTPTSGTLNNCTSNTETANNNSTQLATTAYADRLLAGTSAAIFTSDSANRFYINAINATLPALNIVASDFIDHAFDTDGGAWTRKCQGKSWYTEARTLGKQWGSYATATAATAAGAVVGDSYYNTTNSRFEELTSGTTSTVTYRAGKAEMPMRMLATAEAGRLILWDCDGAEITMWMVFITSASYYLGGIANVSCIALKEADICYGVSGAGNGVSRINFLSERRYYYGTSVATSVIYNGLISLRNSAQQPVWEVLNPIVNAIVNSVAITILPDAPVDEYGMPIPTIAVATAGGISIIKSDGTVVNSNSTVSHNSVEFNGQDDLFWGYTASSNFNGAKPATWKIAAFASDFSNWTYLTRTLPISNSLRPVAMKDYIAVGSSVGICYVVSSPSLTSVYALAIVTSVYNTGYMVGDIRRCFLANSQTVDRSVKAATLTVVGTPTETVNAGGRNVYSGFTNANYFQEASHADWNALGTGDFSILMSGVKWGTAATLKKILSVGNGATAGSISLEHLAANTLAFYIWSAVPTKTVICTSTGTFTDTTEHVIEVSRSTVSGVTSTVQIKVDGVVVASAVSTLTISNATGFLRIGEGQDASNPWTGGFCSCVRISATAPTAEQSKYIAAQENVLNGGALCLLSNNSSVAALSSDSQGNLLYVGNGTNVDTFDGLKRIASEAHGVTTLQTLASSSGVRFFGGTAGGKAQAAIRDINAELQSTMRKYPRTQQYLFTTPAATTTQALPKGWKAQGIAFNTTDSTFLGTYTQTFDGFIWTVAGLTASKAYQVNLVSENL